MAALPPPARRSASPAAAVGLQIRALETDLNQALFDRSGRAIVLNTAGRGLVEPVKDLVARYEALPALQRGEELTGTVVIGALVSALMGSFADGLWALMRKHPGLEVKLFAGLSADFARRVDRGELDAAVIAQPPDRLPSSLIWTALYSEPLVLIVPRRPHFRYARGPAGNPHAKPVSAFRPPGLDRPPGQRGAGTMRRHRQGRDGAELGGSDRGIGAPGVRRVDRAAAGQRAMVARPVAADRPLPAITVQRHVGLLERKQHSRKRFTDAIRAHFAPVDLTPGS